MSTAVVVIGMYPRGEPAVARYLGTAGPFMVFLTSEPDAAGTCYEVFDLWHQRYTVAGVSAGNPERLARLTGAEGRALAEMLKRPG